MGCGRFDNYVRCAHGTQGFRPRGNPIIAELMDTYNLLFRSKKNTEREDLIEYGLLPIPEWLRVFYGDKNGPLSEKKAKNLSYFLQSKTQPMVGDMAFHLRCISPDKSTKLFNEYKIWGDRLRILKAHMDSQKPGGLRGLWEDNRDSLQWYTFWAVVIVGSFSLVLSFLGLIVGIVQAVGTFRAP